MIKNGRRFGRRSGSRFAPKRGFVPPSNFAKEASPASPRGRDHRTFWDQRTLFSLPDDGPKGGGPVTLWPYQKGIGGALSDPDVDTVVVMGSSQAGKTMLITMELGHVIVDDPAATLVITPTSQDRKIFVEEKWKALVESNHQVLSRMIRPGKVGWSRDLMKMGNGAPLRLAISTAEGSYRQSSSKYVILDELDIFEPPAGIEPVTAAERRRSRFGTDSTMLIASTPHVSLPSRTFVEYEKWDQCEFHVDCPHCGESFMFRWSDVDEQAGVYRCRFCEDVVDDRYWDEMNRNGRWVATSTPIHSRGRSFRFNHFNVPGMTMEELMNGLKLAMNSRRQFMADFMGEPLIISGEDFTPETLELAEMFQERPFTRVDAVFAAVDVQKDRYVYMVVEWNKRSDLFHIVLMRDVERTRGELESHMRLVDLVMAFNPEVVSQDVRYDKDQCLKNILDADVDGWIPVMGSSMESTFNKPLVMSEREGIRTLAVDEAKDVWRDLMERRAITATSDPSLLPRDFVEQLTAEERVHVASRGMIKPMWRKTRTRNEALDLIVYTICAARRWMFDNPDYSRVDDEAYWRVMGE